MRYANYKSMVQELQDAKAHLIAAEKAYAWTVHELTFLEDNPDRLGFDKEKRLLRTLLGRLRKKVQRLLDFDGDPDIVTANAWDVLMVLEGLE